MFKRVRKAWGEDRRGAVVVLVAVTGTLMAGFAALTVDLGNMYIVRTELQRAADAGALAGVSQLANYQAGISETAAQSEAKRIVEANPVGAQKVTIDTSKDVIFGHAVWSDTQKRYNFVAGGTAPTAVRVAVRKTADSPNGSMNLMFANVWGLAHKDMWAQASAMIVPRDISIVADLSGSMSYDSQLHNYKVTTINLWGIWINLPVQRGTNGADDGIHSATMASAINQTGRLQATYAQHPEYTGPVWGRMKTWGTTTIDSSYSPSADAGLIYLPYGQSWTSNTALTTWLTSVGYSSSEITTIESGTSDTTAYYIKRVKIALGLARWDSGKSGGLWSKLPNGVTPAKKTGNNDSKIDDSEVSMLVAYPFPGQPSWDDYIGTYMCSSSTWMYSANSAFEYRFGLKTFINYLLETQQRYYVNTPDLVNTPEQWVQAVKDAVTYCMNLLTTDQSDDQVSLEIFGTTAHHEKDLTKVYSTVSDRLNAMDAAYYDPDTNMGGGIAKAITELTSSRSRSYATKTIFLLTDGQPNVTSSGQTGNDSGGQSYALSQATAAVNAGIQIFCVSVGSQANRSLMQQIASMGNGQEFYATGTIDQYSAQLKSIFEELGTKRTSRLID